MNTFQWVAIAVPVIALHVFLWATFCRDWLDNWLYVCAYSNRVKLDFFLCVAILLAMAVDVGLVIWGYCIFINFLGAV